MEQIFSHTDGWGTQLIVLGKDGQIGINTHGGLVVLNTEDMAKLYEALGKFYEAIN